MEGIYAEGSAERDWEFEARAEARYQREVCTDNRLWEDHEENWVEITEFVGFRKKPLALQLGLFEREVA